MSEDPARDAEFEPGNYARVEADVRKALKRSGCILPETIIEAVTCTVLEEALQTRRRMTFMVSSFNEAFGNELTPERLSRLELILLCHYRDAHNMTYLPVPDDEV